MSNALIVLGLLGIIATIVLVAMVLVRQSRAFDSAAGTVRDELRMGREEAQQTAARLREELVAGLKASNETLVHSLKSMGALQQTQLTGMTTQLKDLTDSSQASLERIRAAAESQAKALQESNEKKLSEIRASLDERLGAMTTQLKETADANHATLEQLRGLLDARVKELQQGNEKKLSEIRTSLDEKLGTMTAQLKEMTDSNHAGMRQVRDLLDTRVKELQEGNERKLGEMRKTVDEKLHDTLEKRLGESFKLVSERLESVHKGLGEMQTLASGVGDLKRVLSNVKARGTWGEVQLGAILAQFLAPGQYKKNVRPAPDSTETVEYAVRLPGPQDDPTSCVWLPIDSKFPQEDYLRLQDAAEAADADATLRAIDALSRTVRAAAKAINEKYLKPPATTDFGIMFLATEGLYAEVLRQPDLVDELQQRYRVIVAGPTTLAAILTSLQMGFQTLAIEQRAAQVWRILGAVRTEFDKFGGVLDKVRRQLNSASRTIEQTGVRSRAMERKLRTVERMPDGEAARILELPALTEEIEAEDAELSAELEPLDDEDGAEST